MFRSPQSTVSAIALTLFAVAAATAQAPAIGKCPVLPADSIWNTPVDQLPVSPNSSAWVTTIGAAKTVHADFGSGLYNGAPIGIPYVTVLGTQIKYPASFTYASESEPGPYALPLNAPIEGGSQSTGDRHALSLDTDNCILYELYAAYPQAASWTAGSGAIFNLLSNALRPSGWTSTDAAGLAVFPGLLRYDEIAGGAIQHAIRFTVPQTQSTFVWPARHAASSLTGAQYPPMGARFRLRAGFDISSYSAANQVILRAMQKFGMMLADNGSAWYISGAPDSRWDNDDLHNLGLIKGSDFEAVDVSGLMIDANSGQAKQSTTVSVTVSPSAATVPVNTTEQFTATVTNATTQIVNWSVNGAPGGNSSVGLIGAGGLYTAPAIPPSGGTVTVQAASAVSPLAAGTATVNVTAPVPPVAPLLSSIAPNKGTQGTNIAVTLTGSNFLPGATVAISGAGVSAGSVTVVSSTLITATLTITATAATGAHSITVATSTGASAAQPFTVNAPVPAKPTLSSLTPNGAARGATVTVTLKGTNFTAAPTVTVQGSVVTVSNVVVVSSTTITATFRVSATAARRSRNTTVTTPAGTSNVLPFTVR